MEKRCQMAPGPPSLFCSDMTKLLFYIWLIVCKIAANFALPSALDVEVWRAVEAAYIDPLLVSLSPWYAITHCTIIELEIVVHNT